MTRTTDPRPATATAPTLPLQPGADLDAAPDAPPRPVLANGRSAIGTHTPLAIRGIFILVLLMVVHYARDFLLPVVTALLLFFVFVPLQRRLQNMGLPGNAVAGILVLGLLAGIAAIFFLLSGPVMQVAENLPEIIENITRRFEAVRDALVTAVQSLRDSGTNGVPDLRASVGVDVTSDSDDDDSDEALLMSTATGALSYLAETPAKIAQVAFMLVLLFFLLSSSDLIYLKIVQSFDAFSDKRAALNALREIETNLGGYLGAVTLINAGLGASVGLAMWLLGMPVPLMFAVLAFTLNFIPFLGAVAGVLLTGVVAILWFDDLQSVLLVILTYTALTALEGQLITPLLLARQLRINKVFVFLSVAFWAWMWSFMGMLIAVPLLVAVRVIAEQVPGARKIANFLSAERSDLAARDRRRRAAKDETPARVDK